MSFLRNVFPNGLWVATAALGLVLSAAACSQSDFSGSSANRNGADLRGKGTADNNDGDDNNDGGNTGGNTGGSDSTGGGEGSDSKNDGGIEGDDNSDNGGIEGDDSLDGKGDDDDDDDLNSDDDEKSKKTRSDMEIQQTRQDDKHQVKVELLIKGKVQQTEEFGSPGKGKNITLKDMCRKDLETCVKITFIGKLTQTAGAASCVFVKEQDATTQKVDVDTNGAGFLGSCKPDEDETYLFKCPDSKSLKVQNCNG